MDDKFVYLFISIMAFINLFLLLSSDEYKRCFLRQECPKITIITIFAFYLHYFIHCFSLYGFLFNNKILLLIYLLTPPIIGTSWMFFTTKHFSSSCVLTNFTDTLCDIENGNSIKFIDIYRSMGIPDVKVINSSTNTAYMVIMIVGYFIGLVKLFFF